MKVKVTATITYESEVTPDDYAEIEDGPKTEDDVLTFEREDIGSAEEGYSGLVLALVEEGTLSDIKIERVEETAAPAASEAA